MQTDALAYFEAVGPPSSPPTIHLLRIKIMKHKTATIKKIITEGTSAPDGTL